MKGFCERRDMVLCLNNPHYLQMKKDTWIEFIGFHTKYNLFTIYKMHRAQLPFGIFPIAEMDDRNYICMSNNKRYIWIHDYNAKSGLFWVSTSINKFILSIEKIPEINIDISQVQSEYSDHFWNEFII